MLQLQDFNWENNFQIVSVIHQPVIQNSAWKHLWVITKLSGCTHHSLNIQSCIPFLSVTTILKTLSLKKYCETNVDQDCARPEYIYAGYTHTGS